MVISSSGNFAQRAPLRVSERQGSAKSPAMETLVPGDYRQTEQDLAAFPQPVLDLLSRNGTRVAILGSGQTLADTPGLRTLSADQASSERPQVNSKVLAKVAEQFPNGVDSLDQLEAGAETITRGLRQAGVENHLAIALRPFPLEALAEYREIPADKVEDWKGAFSQLNEGLYQVTDQGIQATQGLLVLPHTYHHGEVVPESRLRNAREVTAEYVERSFGLNRSDEKMVLLHDKFLGSPAAEVGNYRLAIHEVGHALDHALERLANFPGFGALHRQTVDALFAADTAKLEALGRGAEAEQVFTSDRADDDVREYFAEAVEAYLTPASSDGGDTFRAGNSKEGLAAKNPALYSYLEKVMTTDFPSTALPESHPKELVPPGIPDPDLEVFRIS